jgi:hypothetical protein
VAGGDRPSGEQPERLSERRLNRALLARQCLLQRSTAALTDVVEQVGGLQTQYAPSGYIGLWSRVARFERERLTEELSARELVQATMMRVTIHLISAADYWPLTSAIRRSRREWFARVAGRDIEGLDVDGVAAAVREELTGGPLRMKELIDRLGRRGYPPQAAKWAGIWVDLVRVPPSGTWEQRRADLYGLAETWLPPSRTYAEADGLDLLVRRYLGAFGPARPASIADWAGVPVSLLSDAVKRFAPRRFRDDDGRELVDVSTGALPDEDTKAPVRFLPTWDASLLVHARRTQILPEQYRPLVFNTWTPHSVGTFLIDGQVAGTWRYERGRVTTSAFAQLPKSSAREVNNEAELLESFHR